MPNVKGILLSIALLVFSISANATVIVGSTTTTDVTNNLEYIHLDQVASTTHATALGGISFGGNSYSLATGAQFASFVASATGLPLNAWYNNSWGDYDLGSAISSVITALMGSDVSITPQFHLTDGYAVAHHQGFDDIHAWNNINSGTISALYVRNTSDVPAPAPLALLGLGLAALGYTRKRKV